MGQVQVDARRLALDISSLDANSQECVLLASSKLFFHQQPSGGHAGDELTLEEQEEDKHWQCGEDWSRHQQIILRFINVYHAGDPNRQGKMVVRAHDDEGPEQVVPHVLGKEDKHGPHRGLAQRQDKRSEGAVFRSAVYPGGFKQFKQRLTGAGMRWSRPAAERMLVIRAAVMTNNFDALWAAALN
jgi:hypothetical protein